MWSDPIADMLTRIRNAVMARRKEVRIPSSKLKVGIARVLKDEGYIQGFDVIEGAYHNVLRVELKYGARGEDVIHGIRRESKSSRRLYKKRKDLPRVLDGLGIAVVSTSEGVLSDRICRDRNLGGELLCTVY